MAPRDPPPRLIRVSIAISAAVLLLFALPPGFAQAQQPVGAPIKLTPRQPDVAPPRGLRIGKMPSVNFDHRGTHFRGGIDLRRIGIDE